MATRSFVSAIVLLLGLTPLCANPPESHYIFPAGGQRGTTVNIKVGGLFLYEKCNFEMLGGGVLAPEHLKRTKTIWFEGPLVPMPASQRKEDYPKDMAAEIRIDKTAKLGMRPWRVWTSEGVTPARHFIVGDLPEVVEKEIDGDPVPVAVKLPVTINGRIFPRADVDIWAITAKKGQQITCVVNAARIGTPLDARLEIRDSNGRRIAENDDAYSADPFVRFTAPADGAYQVRIHDIAFSGGQAFVYRLTVTADAYVDRVFPLGGKRGAAAALQLSGQGTPSAPVNIRLPDLKESRYYHRFTFGGKSSNRVSLELDDLLEYIESPEKTNFSLPAVFNGRIDRPGDMDVWPFNATKGEVFEFELKAGRLGSPLDGVLTVVDANGKQLSRAETSAKQPDPVIRLKIPNDGAYSVRVQDRFGSRGGPEFAYRLRASHPRRADFGLTLQKDALTVLRKGKAKLRVTVDRIGGFKEAIKLAVNGLPQGVTVKGTEIAKNRGHADLQFEANENAKIQTARVTIAGTSAIDKKKVTRTARFAMGDVDLSSVRLAVAMPVPFRIKGVYTMVFVPRGAVHLRKYEIERKGYDGPIAVSMTDKQARHLQGVTGPTVIVPAGATKFTYPVKLPPWMELGRTCRVCVMGVATVKDKDGSPHAVCHSSVSANDQFVAVVGPGPLVLTLPKSSFGIRPGQTIQIPVIAKRAKKLKGSVTIELIAPAHLPAVRALKSAIPAGKEKATLSVRADSTLRGPINMPLIVRATLLKDGRPFIAEDRIELINVTLPSNR